MSSRFYLRSRSKRETDAHYKYPLHFQLSTTTHNTQTKSTEHIFHLIHPSIHPSTSCSSIGSQHLRSNELPGPSLGVEAAGPAPLLRRPCPAVILRRRLPRIAAALVGRRSHGARDQPERPPGRGAGFRHAHAALQQHRRSRVRRRPHQERRRCHGVGERGKGGRELLGTRAAEAVQSGRHGVEMVMLSAMGFVLRGRVDRPGEAPRPYHHGRQVCSLARQDSSRSYGHLLPEEVRLSRHDVGDGGRGAGNGGGAAAAPALAPAVRAQRGLDPGAAGGGGERADAPDDLHGGVAAAVVRARPRRHRPGRLLQRLLRRLPALPQARPPHGRLPRGGGHPLLHRVPPGPRGRQDRERPRSGHRHRLLAPAPRRHLEGRRHRRARRRSPPPRRQPLCIGHPLPGA